MHNIKSLKAKCFSLFLGSLLYGTKSKKELNPDVQAFNFGFWHNNQSTSVL